MTQAPNVPNCKKSRCRRADHDVSVHKGRGERGQRLFPERTTGREAGPRSPRKKNRSARAGSGLAPASDRGLTSSPSLAYLCTESREHCDVGAMTSLRAHRGVGLALWCNDEVRREWQRLCGSGNEQGCFGRYGQGTSLEEAARTNHGVRPRGSASSFDKTYKADRAACLISENKRRGSATRYNPSVETS